MQAVAQVVKILDVLEALAAKVSLRNKNRPLDLLQLPTAPAMVAIPLVQAAMASHLEETMDLRAAMVEVTKILLLLAALLRSPDQKRRPKRKRRRGTRASLVTHRASPQHHLHRLLLQIAPVMGLRTVLT